MLTGNATEIAAVLAAFNETGGIPISVSMVAEQNKRNRPGPGTGSGGPARIFTAHLTGCGICVRRQYPFRSRDHNP
ncbi:MAG: hypothetical protein WC277_12755, partial [Bacilli bacterium]